MKPAAGFIQIEGDTFWTKKETVRLDVTGQLPPRTVFFIFTEDFPPVTYSIGFQNENFSRFQFDENGFGPSFFFTNIIK